MSTVFIPCLSLLLSWSVTKVCGLNYPREFVRFNMQTMEGSAKELIGTSCNQRRNTKTSEMKRSKVSKLIRFYPPFSLLSFVPFRDDKFVFEIANKFPSIYLKKFLSTRLSDILKSSASLCRLSVLLPNKQPSEI